MDEQGEGARWRGKVEQELVLQEQMNTAVFTLPNPVLSRAQTFLSLSPVERRERRSGICAHPMAGQPQI